LPIRIAEAPVPTHDPGAFAQLDDAGLVSAIRDGHDRAFEVFYMRHRAGVLSFSRHMLGSREDAEDAVQQTFLATHRQMHSSTPPTHPKAWLYTVARNRCLTTLRARRETLTEEAPEPATEGLAEEVERRYELRQLLRDLGRLPEDQRVALLLFELGALSHAEIAETIGCAPNKVKALVYQARTTLAHRAEARNARCAEVRQQLATLRGGTLNSRSLKHHLDICDGCTEYRDALRRQRRGLAVILPVIPLATLHGRVLGALGLGNGASHAVAAASHAGAGHSATVGASHAATGRLAWVAAHAARPRLAAIAALTAGAATSLVMLTTGHRHKAVMPPAEAAAPKVAPHRAAPGAHRAARPAHRAAHRTGPTAHAAALASHRAARKSHVPRTGKSPAGGRQRGPSTGNAIRRPKTHTPAASKPPPAGKPAPNRPPNSKPPKSAPPSSAPTQPPSGSTGSTPAPSPSPAPCAPNGQGHGWGHCKGPDGLPPPAEQHRQGSGSPGGP
jgi:RNA polymerase sigma factor (sigma-70 family)